MVATLSLKALIAEHDECLDKLEELEKAADDGAMSDDQLSQYQELTEKADELEEKIAARKAAEASLAKNKKRKRLSASSGRQTDPDGGEGRIGATVHQNFKDDPNKGYRTPREFMMDVMEVGLGHKEPDERLTYLAVASG